MILKGIDFGPIVTVLPKNGAFTLVAPEESKRGSATFSRRRIVMRGGGVMLEADRPVSRTLSEFLESVAFRSNPEPFFVAVSVVGTEKEDRLQELREMAALVSSAKDARRFGFGIVLDISSLTLGFGGEIEELLFVLFSAGVPIAVQASVLSAPGPVSDVAGSEACDALFVSQSVPWASLSSEARRVFFRRKESPFLGSKNGGSVSGKYIVPLTSEWVRQVRRQGMQKPIAAGGVISPKELDLLSAAGVTALLKDSVAVRLRPWNVLLIFRKARTLFF